MRPSLRSLVLALCLCPALAAAHDYRAGSIAIDHPFARATLPGAAVGGAYMALRNDGTTADRLVAASTPAAERVEFHSMTMQGDVMRMTPIKAGIELPPGETVSVRPGGLHLMLVGLKAPLAQGTRVPMTLDFASGARVEVELAVEAPNAGAGSAGAEHEHGAHGEAGESR
ncbi:copper chaperone PCu(A)C [Antarcticirhabdus aurantiaca]|uniref:Copper chaperone PCu(A)C n=1 Tax=Antarcticirhabdus aurantiaca TaxID=2606717 RepID=A0ACD4NRZ0_9HYPH|nr:copper chaperone PCu(A)C [Antarcticirhabdus aurantiaca]WAJ29596.1 copper chaperone PCu(A)C [Jeongeuplla avenae]